MTREEQEKEIREFLQDKLDIYSKNALYIEAFTHDAGDFKDPKNKTNQRLAYLGDMVVNFSFANHAFLQYPDYDKGQLTEECKTPRSDPKLAEAFIRLGLTDNYIIKPPKQVYVDGEFTVRAKVVEALFGAIYLDQGFEKARALAEKHLLQP